MTLLTAARLNKVYEGRSIINDVSIEIRPGESLAIIGPTGSGKTTLIRMLDLLEKPTSGHIYFDGIDVTNNRHNQLEMRRKMAYVQQKPVVFSMNVFDNVAYGLKWRKFDGNSTKNKVKDALELVEMADYASRNAKTLSGGETQRIAIARALVTQPQILFLDEPTANLDPISTSKIEKVIHSVVSEKSIAVVMATHDMVLGQQISNRIGVILEGKLMQVGSPRDVFSSPVNQRVAEFVGIENLLPGEIVSKEENILTIQINGANIQAISDNLAEGPVYALVRPEDIIISSCQIQSSARNVLHGKISKSSEVGPMIRLEIDCGFPLVALITRSSAIELELEAGHSICANFKVNTTHAIRRII